MTKKMINLAKDVVRETFDGFLAMHKNEFKQIDNLSAVVKRQLDPGKVGLLVGGGSGHEPLFMEYIGKGFADAVANGNVFAAPSPDTVLAATKAINRGKGVLYVYGNYAGDNLNFDMGAELADFEGIRTETVRVWDDVASAPLDRISDRRGIAGDFFVIKVAGAACEAGLDLDEVKRVTVKARDNIRTMGVAIAPGTIPGESAPSFTLPDDEMEIGMGLHGEAGVRRGKMMPVDTVVDEMLDLIIQDLPFKKGDDVCVLVNGYGSTTRMELFIAMRHVLQVLEAKGFNVYFTEAGNFATCQEMAGISVTLMRVDSELKRFIDAPVWSPVFKK